MYLPAHKEKCALVVALLLSVLFTACGSSKRTASARVADRPASATTRPGVAKERDLRRKYASMMNVSSSDIRNLELYHFIDHWYSTPYKYGGNDLTGVDCSGFVFALFRDVYQRKIARNSEQMFRMNCVVIPSGQLREGDLVFFRVAGGDRIDHVGFYLHNDFFVHATSSRGVVLDKLTDPYWEKRFYKAASVNYE